jgi:hypothetical protein
MEAGGSTGAPLHPLLPKLLSSKLCNLWQMAAHSDIALIGGGHVIPAAVF